MSNVEPAGYESKDEEGTIESGSLGAFHTSPTGGQKDIAGKPRLDLVPIEFVEGAANAFAFGANKYSAHNWRKGIEVSILVRSLLSHVMKYNDGEDKDHESNLHHLDHACATLAMLITTAKTMPHMDNRYGKALRTPLGEFIIRQEAAGNAINSDARRTPSKRAHIEAQQHQKDFDSRYENPEGRV